ncbi:holo-ACP synthase [Candidatus Woesearchaeota archaeon]|nr:holo-ACP synthase [Candidatus Woesearchaeota archaeon]
MIATGVDIVHIPTIEHLLEDPATLKRMLHASELSHPDPQHLAGIIAAKEAFFKAFEMRPQWHEIEVKAKSNGKPVLVLSTKWERQIMDLDVSISHDHEYAIAQVVVQKREKEAWQKKQ